MMPIGSALIRLLLVLRKPTSVQLQLTLVLGLERTSRIGAVQA